MTIGIDPAILPSFALTMALIELTPGPNLGYLALLGASQGRRAGLWAVAGITLGLGVWLGVTLFGLVETPLHSPAGLRILRGCGSAYLLWLAFDAVRPTGRPGDAFDAGRPFFRGLVSNLLNPKAALFYVALLPGFLRPAAGPISGQILILGSLHILISMTIHAAAVFGAASAATRMSPQGARLFRLVLAGGLAALAVWFLFTPVPQERAF